MSMNTSVYRRMSRESVQPSGRSMPNIMRNCVVMVVPNVANWRRDADTNQHQKKVTVT